jgi:hypothetical protein
MFKTRIHTWFANHPRIASCAASSLVLLLLTARMLAFAHIHDEHGTPHICSQDEHSHKQNANSTEHHNTPQDEYSCDLCDILLLGNSDEISTLTLNSVAHILDYTEILTPHSPEHSFYSCIQDRAPPALLF